MIDPTLGQDITRAELLAFWRSCDLEIDEDEEYDIAEFLIWMLNFMSRYVGSPTRFRRSALVDHQYPSFSNPPSQAIYENDLDDGMDDDDDEEQQQGPKGTSV